MEDASDQSFTSSPEVNHAPPTNGWRSRLRRPMSKGDYCCAIGYPALMLRYLYHGEINKRPFVFGNLPKDITCIDRGIDEINFGPDSMPPASFPVLDFFIKKKKKMVEE